MPRNTKEQRISQLGDAMEADYRGKVDPEVIRALVRSTYERLCAESRVTDFVPILAARRVRAHLRAQFGGPPRAAGTAPDSLEAFQDDER